MRLERIIKNGTIVTATDIYIADIGIANGKIVEIGEHLSANSSEIINAEGKYIFPGGIDVHTHLELPVCGTISKDDFKTGTIAAACGGTTSIIDFCTQNKGQTLTEALEIWHAKAKNKAAIDYGFHVAISEVNDHILAEIKDIIKKGYPSFKLYMTYEDLRVDDGDFLKVLIQTKKHGGIVCVHAENHYIIKYMIAKFNEEGKTEPIYHALSRPPLAESEATNRAIKLALFADAPLYIVHLTCKLALDEVARARKISDKIMAETCPQYLLLSEDNLREENFNGAKYVLSPPLRTIDNQNYLWQGLADNEIQAVSTDHCSFDFKGQKDMGRDFFANIPNGAPGIETRIPLIFDRGVNSGKISLNRFVEITATNPAKIFGMYPEKGTIAIGADADIVIFDPQLKKTITQEMLHENVDYTAYEGFKITGYPIMTLSRGNVVAKNGKFVGEIGSGKFIARKKPMLI